VVGWEGAFTHAVEQLAKVGFDMLGFCFWALAVLSLYSHCTLTVLSLYSYYIPTILPLQVGFDMLIFSFGSVLYSHCTHTVLILYSYCTHTVLILYSHFKVGLPA
jgi:hypothetical protein